MSNKKMERIAKKKTGFFKRVLGHSGSSSNVVQVQTQDQVTIESDFRDNASVSSVR